MWGRTLRVGGERLYDDVAGPRKATKPCTGSARLLFLLLVLGGCCSLVQVGAATVATRGDRLTLRDVEAILRARKHLLMKDALHRRLLVSLSGNRPEHLSFTSGKGQFPPVLFATVTPCTLPVERAFSQVDRNASVRANNTMKVYPSLRNEHVHTRGSDPGDLSHRKLMGSRSVTYKLDTLQARQLFLRLQKQSPVPPELAIPGAGSAKVLLQLSTKHPGVELGVSRYKLQLCTDSGGEEHNGLRVPVRVMMDHVLTIDYRHQHLYRIYVVVNTVRELPEYCSAQVALQNSLPFRRPGIADYVGDIALPDGSWASTIVNYTVLWREHPSVDIGPLLRRDPAVLYVNAYVFKADEDNQADATAWETLVYYRKDPASGRRHRLVRCDRHFDSESQAELLQTGTVRAPADDPVTFESEIAVRMAVNSSLLIRPGWFDLRGSAVQVEVTPYGGQSVSMRTLASGASCRDSVWPYGGVVCSRDGKSDISSSTRWDWLHTCLPGDDEACKFDWLRVRVWQLQWPPGQDGRGTKIVTTRKQLTTWPFNNIGRRFHWQFVLTRRHDNKPDVIRPLIGRVSEAMYLLSGLVMETGNIIHSHTDAKSVLDRLVMGLSVCRAVFSNQTKPKSDYELPARSYQAAECYKQLLQLQLFQDPDRSLCRSHQVDIAWPGNSAFSPVYSPQVNKYEYMAFRLQLDANVAKWLSAVKKPLRVLKWRQDYVKRLAVAQLLSSVTTWYSHHDRTSSTRLTPTANHSGKAARTTRRSSGQRHRHSVKYPESYPTNPIASISLYKQLRTESLNFTVELPEPDSQVDAYAFAILVYATPRQTRRRNYWPPLSLFTFQVLIYDSVQITC